MEPYRSSCPRSAWLVEQRHRAQQAGIRPQDGCANANLAPGCPRMGMNIVLQKWQNLIGALHYRSADGHRLGVERVNQPDDPRSPYRQAAIANCDRQGIPGPPASKQRRKTENLPSRQPASRESRPSGADLRKRPRRCFRLYAAAAPADARSSMEQDRDVTAESRLK